MRKFLQGVWQRIRLGVIIVLSITIGASYAIAIPQYLEIRKSADETWTHVQSIQEQRKENKNTEDDAPAVDSKDETAREVSLEGEADDTLSVSPPSIEETIYKVAKEKQFKDPELLVRIARAESSLQACVKNSHSSAIGIFQILDMHGLTKDERCNPKIATEWAVAHFNNGNPWNSSRSKWQ